MVGIGDGYYDAAKIDDAGPFYILYRIIMPLAIPGIAPEGLFTSLNYWNEWFLGMCIITVDPIIFAYPFFQKYFIRGLTVGSIKHKCRSVKMLQYPEKTGLQI